MVVAVVWVVAHFLQIWNCLQSLSLSLSRCLSLSLSLSSLSLSLFSPYKSLQFYRLRSGRKRVSCCRTRHYGLVLRIRSTTSSWLLPMICSTTVRPCLSRIGAPGGWTTGPSTSTTPGWWDRCGFGMRGPHCTALPAITALRGATVVSRGAGLTVLKNSLLYFFPVWRRWLSTGPGSPSSGALLQFLVWSWSTTTQAGNSVKKGGKWSNWTISRIGDGLVLRFGGLKASTALSHTCLHWAAPLPTWINSVPTKSGWRTGT